MRFFQNGLCERVHVITDSMLIKLEEEHGEKDCQDLLSCHGESVHARDVREGGG